MKIPTLLVLSLIVTPALAQNTVCFTVQTNPNTGAEFSGLPKYVDVYGFSIYAKSSIPDENVLHAATVAAELLDNDEDGVVDDAVLMAELVSKGALIPIFIADGSSAQTAFFDNYNGDGASAELYLVSGRK